MDITKQLQAIEKQLETYEETFDPEEKMDLKQSIQIDIKEIKLALKSLPENLQKNVQATLSDFEEILTY